MLSGEGWVRIPNFHPGAQDGMGEAVVPWDASLLFEVRLETVVGSRKVGAEGNEKVVRGCETSASVLDIEGVSVRYGIRLVDL